MRHVLHDAVHNVPLARLVFIPEHDGRLHRCAIGALEAGYDITGGGKEAKREHGQISVDDAERETAA